MRRHRLLKLSLFDTLFEIPSANHQCISKLRHHVYVTDKLCELWCRNWEAHEVTSFPAQHRSSCTTSAAKTMKLVEKLSWKRTRSTALHSDRRRSGYDRSKFNKGRANLGSSFQKQHKNRLKLSSDETWEQRGRRHRRHLDVNLKL